MVDGQMARAGPRVGPRVGRCRAEYASNLPTWRMQVNNAGGEWDDDRWSARLVQPRHRVVSCRWSSSRL